MFESLTVFSSYVRDFGVWAPLVTFLFFVIQAALPVFPYLILAAAGGMLFGMKIGFLLAWTGALTGASLCYWVCRWLGHAPLSEWLMNRYGFKLDNHDPRVAFWSIVVARVLPFVPTPFINIAAAVGGVPFWNFFFSSAIGKIPTAFLYTGVGLALFNARDINTILLIVAGTVVLLLGLKVLAKKYYSKKQFEKGLDLPRIKIPRESETI